MRYDTSHKEQTHQRIIDVAARLFKEQGIDATGVAAVMSEAKLTNGAFYAHFKSKEALVEEVVADQLDQQFKNFWETPKNISGLKEIIRLYLSPEHRDNYGEGCPSAALLEEIGRRSTSTKQAYDKGVVRIVDKLQEYLPSSSESNSLAFALISLLIGTMQMARAMTDEKVSNAVLESGYTAALALLEKP